MGDEGTDLGDLGCWVLGWTILDTILGGILVVALDGWPLVVGLGVYVALSAGLWAAFWYYHDDFR